MKIGEMVMHGVSHILAKLFHPAKLCDACRKEPGVFEYGRQELCLSCMRQEIQERRRRNETKRTGN